DDRTVALQTGRSGLVPGGAAQYGRLGVRRHIPGMGAQPDWRQASARPLCRPARLGVHRGRANVHSPGAARQVFKRGVGMMEDRGWMSEVRREFLPATSILVSDRSFLSSDI